jgi:hypothetical protein
MIIKFSFSSLLLATQLCIINTFCQMDLGIGKVFTLSFSPHMSKFQYKPSIHPKNTGAQHTKTHAFVKQLALTLDIRIPNDLDLDLYFPLLSHKDIFGGQIDHSFVLCTTNIEQILKNLYIAKS